MNHPAAALIFTAIAGLQACGGDGDSRAMPESPSRANVSLDGGRVTSRNEAMQIVARGIVAPLYASELTHAVLLRAFEAHAAEGHVGPVSAGDHWVLELDGLSFERSVVLQGSVRVEIESVNGAEGLMLRGEAGSVRAVLRFEPPPLGSGTQIDGAIEIEVRRPAGETGAVHVSRAEALSVRDGGETLRWSYLNVVVDTRRRVENLAVVSNVPVEGEGPVWIDVATSTPGQLALARDGTSLRGGRYVAAGVAGFLKASLVLEVKSDGGWVIAIDNDKDQQIDFVEQASSGEVSAFTSTEPVVR